MPKPTTPPPQWATDETNNTEPSLAQKETGWTPAQDGVSDYDNWQKRETYRWLSWLADEVAVEDEFSAHARAWVPEGTAASPDPVLDETTQAWEFLNLGDNVTHSLHYLRAGTKIATIEWQADRNSTGDSISVGLYRRANATGVTTPVQEDVVSTFAASGYDVVELTYNHTMQVGYTYWLMAFGGDGSVPVFRFYGASIHAELHP